MITTSQRLKTDTASSMRILEKASLEASWNGVQTAEQDDRVGMLLDLVSTRIPKPAGGE